MNHQNSAQPRLVLILALAIGLGAIPRLAPAEPAVEQWGVFEIGLNGPATGNPFVEVELAARAPKQLRSMAVSMIPGLSGTAARPAGSSCARARVSPSMPHFEAQ